MAETNGLTILQSRIATMSELPGIYRMLDAHDKVIYVGKARNLKKRLLNYTHFDKLVNRIKMMVFQIAKIEVTITNTEAEALLLEANLIKKLQPRYNILLKDDKSFPYIVIKEDHPFPQITKYRGKKLQDRYFGPFASVKAVNDTIAQIQKIFLLRPCSDNYFANRKRACLQYQIRRCSAPCVDKVSQEDYKDLVEQTIAFLSGKTNALQKRLSSLMAESSRKMDYEKAAIYRDKIRSLTAVQASQSITIDRMEDADIIALAREGKISCVQIFFFRAGQNFGNKSYFPVHSEDSTELQILLAFIGQFYQNHIPPKHIILQNKIAEDDSKLIVQALYNLHQVKVKFIYPKMGNKLGAVKIAQQNAKEALRVKISEQISKANILIEIKNLFAVEKNIKKIEVYDNSHIMGRYAVGAMIVAGESGFIKNEYRKFNIDNSKMLTGGDDYEMLKQVFTRRFARLIKEYPVYTEGVWPDLVIIDGGIGHFNIANRVLQNLNINDIKLVAMAKGIERNAGKEQFFIQKGALTLDKTLPVMRYLQIIRDEAHRFAIGSHRIKRSKSTLKSTIDNIPTIGKKRKNLLLNHFGSIEAIQEASIEELSKVELINKKIATIIYNYFHQEV